MRQCQIQADRIRSVERPSVLPDHADSNTGFQQCIHIGIMLLAPLLAVEVQLADLKVKSVDVEAWSPRQKKYFEVGSCSNLGDAQARRLKIRVNGEDGKKYLAHTLNNTVVAPPRMLIAFLENNLNADGTVSIPEVLRMYMGGKEKLVPKH